jgi:hypothetical protein
MDAQKVARMVAAGFLALTGFLLFMSSDFVIDAGERGVVLRGEPDREPASPVTRRGCGAHDCPCQKGTLRPRRRQGPSGGPTTMVLTQSEPSSRQDYRHRLELREKCWPVKESFKAAAARYT